MNKFKAFPKNPAISKVFREIGYADELGSGMRNTNKYTKLYSGGIPTFVEDNIFQITIPIDNVANLKVGPGATAAETIMNNDSKLNLSDKEKIFLEMLIKQLRTDEYVTTTAMSKITNIPTSTVRRYMKKFCELGVLTSAGKNKSTQYCLKKN